MGPPSLVDQCINTAIDNVKYLGDVGAMDNHLLERILPHCTVDQLMNIEIKTKERDLSEVTDKIWKKFYQRKFGDEHTNDVVEWMNKCNRQFLWKQLYQAKVKDQHEQQKLSLAKLSNAYKKERERKQSRQIQICTALPMKRCFSSEYGAEGKTRNVKSKIMKKAVNDYLTCDEFKNRKFMRMKETPKQVIKATRF